MYKACVSERMSADLEYLTKTMVASIISLWINYMGIYMINNELKPLNFSPNIA